MSMSAFRWLDEIDRLFDEMVRDPWRPLHQPTVTRAGREDTHVDVELPIEGGGRGDVSVSVEGQRLTVTALRGATTARGAVSRGQKQRIERSFVLPENTEVSKVEARFEGDVLKIRIGLHSRKD
jgi:HSP20 family molecular chaperone IbpA